MLAINQHVDACFMTVKIKRPEKVINIPDKCVIVDKILGEKHSVPGPLPCNS